MIFSRYRQARSNVLVGETELHFPVLWVVFAIVDVAGFSATSDGGRWSSGKQLVPEQAKKWRKARNVCCRASTECFVYAVGQVV